MNARTWARDRVPELTALLSIASLALVFGAALQVLPVGSLPRSAVLLEAIPHVNAAVSLAAIGTIIAGWRFIREGEIAKHRAMMIASFLLFGLFLVLYLYRVSIRGPGEFPGPAGIQTLLYQLILLIHVLLAMICIPLVFYALLSATTRPVDAIYDTSHGRVGRVAAGLWLIAFAMGLLIYAMLYVIY